MTPAHPRPRQIRHESGQPPPQKPSSPAGLPRSRTTATAPARRQTSAAQDIKREWPTGPLRDIVTRSHRGMSEQPPRAAVMHNYASSSTAGWGRNTGLHDVDKAKAYCTRAKSRSERMPVGRDRVEKEPDGDVLGGRVLGHSACLLAWVWASLGWHPACLVHGGAIGMCSPGPCVGPASRFGGLCAGQLTAERVKMRMAAAVMRIAQPARTSRLRAASVVVLVIPQMLCRPAPVRSSTP